MHVCGGWADGEEGEIYTSIIDFNDDGAWNDEKVML